MLRSENNKKSLFGKFDSVIDETVHVLLAIIVAFVAYCSGVSGVLSMIIFLSGSFLIDVDHVFNTFICKNLLKVPNYKGSLKHGDQGYSPHLFHGIDVAVVVSLLCSLIDPKFGIFLFLSLLGHLLWDFAVYPNNISWLFLVSRAMKGFKVGERKYFVGRIFDLYSLHW